MLSVACLCCFALLVGLYGWLQDGKGHPSNARVAWTKEYQITLSNPAAVTDREGLTRAWVQHFDDNSVFFNVSLTERHTLHRKQSSAKLGGWGSCHVPYDLRVREYRGTNGTDLSIDLKGNARNAKRALRLPFWPASGLKADQKCEEDLHVDYDKFSRETRVYMKKEEVSLLTCGDVARLFPWAIAERYHENPLVFDHLNSWWVRTYDGYLAGTTRFKITMTFEYFSDAHSAQQKRAFHAEWSIRIFSRHDGFLPEWDPLVVADVEQAWRSLLKLQSGPETS